METLRPQTEPRRHILAYAAFLLVTLVAYYPSLRGTLLWDDEAHVTRTNLRDVHGLWQIWTNPKATQQYYPLLNTAFWVEHKLWGDAVLGYHLINVALHALAAYLLVLILRRLNVAGAWLAGLIFALHPVCVEAVAWISEQKSTLSGVFYLSAALLYLKFDEERDRKTYLAASALFACALLSKTVTATLPAALLVVLWSKKGSLERERDVQPLIPWFLGGAAAGLTTAWIEKHYVGADGGDYALSLFERVLLADRVVWFYLSKLIWPRNLTFIYPHWTISTHAWWQYGFLIALLAMVGAFAFYARKNRAPLALLLLFLGTLFPVLGFLNVFPFVYSYVADHFQYLACMTVFTGAAWLITTKTGRAATPLGGLLLLSLTALTWRQTHMYKDVVTLYRETIARNPACWMAYVNLGSEVMNIPGHDAEAEQLFRETLRLRPQDYRAHANLGALYSKRDGNHGLAIAEAQAAIRIKPDFFEAHYILGNEYSTVGRIDDAVAEYERAIKIAPDFVLAKTNLGSLLITIPGRQAEGVRQLEDAVRIAPNSAAGHLNLGVAFSAIPGRMDESLEEFDKAIELDPTNATFHFNKGAAFSRSPTSADAAIQEFEKALRLRPSFAEAHVSIGNILMSKANGREEAIDEYEAALRIDPNLASAHAGLALALASEPKREAEARQHREIAIRLQPRFAKAFKTTADSTRPN